MTLREIDMTLDLDQKRYVYPPIELVQGDHDSLRIHVHVIQGNRAVVDLTGYTISFFTNIPCTKAFVSDDRIDVKEPAKGCFSYTFPKEASPLPGVYDTARFVIRKGKTDLSQMARFTYQVEPDPLNHSTDASGWVSEFQRILEAIRQVQTDYQQMIQGLQKQIDQEKIQQKELEEEIQKLKDEIAKSGYVSKTGDQMNGALSNDQSFDVTYGKLKHWIGEAKKGDKIQVSVGTANTHHLEQDQLTYVIGGKSVGDERLAITSYDQEGFIHGYAPSDYRWATVQIGNQSPVTAQTIQPANAAELGREGDKGVVRLNGEVVPTASQVERTTKTLTDQTLQAAKSYVDGKESRTIWEGGWHMAEGQVAKAAIPLRECKAWVIYWSKYNGEAQNYYWCTQIVTKEVLGGHNMDMMMDGRHVHKYIYVSDSGISGSEENNQGDNAQAVMRKIVAIM